jgi:hypothetical protein
VTNALAYCSVAAVPLTESAAQAQRVGLRRITEKARNPAGKADAAELPILKWFSQLTHSTNTPPPVVTNFTTTEVSVFLPIVITNALCLKCHGEPGKDITPADMDVIRGIYPHDEATGYQQGNLRGAWRVDIPVSELAKRP